MFKKIFVAVVMSGFVATVAIAEESAVKTKEPEGHCEKKDKDGKTSDIEAIDKADCKTKGGRWNKGKPHDDHKEHKDHEDHKEGEK